MMNEPTKEQIQGFWEQCGLKNLSYDRGVWFNWLSHTNKDGKRERVPPIDLNNLFKYAMPALNNRGFGIYKITQHSFHSWDVEIGALTYQGTIQRYMDGRYAAVDRELKDALFWAIYKALGGA